MDNTLEVLKKNPHSDSYGRIVGSELAYGIYSRSKALKSRTAYGR